MTKLTEKWKAGELEEGWYYIKYEDNHVGIAFACEGLGRDEYPFVGFEFEDDIEEVLAPVPSYDELQSLEADRLAKNEGEEIVAELKEENARLKERDEVFSVLIDNLHGLQQEKWYDLVEHGTREQRLDFLRNTEKHTLFGAIDKNMQLRNLLKECKDIIEWYKADCGYKDLPTESVLTKINEVLK